MVKRDSGFHARDLFASLGELNESSCQIIGLVRPHPEDDTIIQVAHPAHPDDWHDVREKSVIGFTPFRAPTTDGDARLARLFLEDGEDHPLAHRVRKLWDKDAGDLAAFAGANAQSVLLGGAQYCYYDAQGRYVCIPI